MTPAVSSKAHIITISSERHHNLQVGIDLAWC